LEVTIKPSNWVKLSKRKLGFLFLLTSLTFNL
jgi:hypothetical protein